MTDIFNVEAADDRVRLFFQCERLDTQKIQDCEKEILDLAAKSPEMTLVLDMSMVKYVSSSFLRVCISIFKIKGKERLELANLDPAVKLVFKVSGLEDKVTIT